MVSYLCSDRLRFHSYYALCIPNTNTLSVFAGTMNTAIGHTKCQLFRQRSTKRPTGSFGSLSAMAVMESPTCGVMQVLLLSTGLLAVLHFIPFGETTLILTNHSPNRMEMAVISQCKMAFLLGWRGPTGSQPILPPHAL